MAERPLASNSQGEPTHSTESSYSQRMRELEVETAVKVHETATEVYKTAEETLQRMIDEEMRTGQECKALDKTGRSERWVNNLETMEKLVDIDDKRSEFLRQQEEALKHCNEKHRREQEELQKRWQNAKLQNEEKLQKDFEQVDRRHSNNMLEIYEETQKYREQSKSHLEKCQRTQESELEQIEREKKERIQKMKEQFEKSRQEEIEKRRKLSKTKRLHNFVTGWLSSDSSSENIGDSGPCTTAHNNCQSDSPNSGNSCGGASSSATNPKLPQNSSDLNAKRKQKKPFDDGTDSLD